jgi:multidrug resistance efflux pump
MSDALAPTDVVPSLRADLTISDPVQGAGEEMVNISDPTNGKELSVRGFELSIARMLNGRRTAQGVIDSASQIGLPISIEGLTGFVRKLKGLGFLAEAGAPEPALTTTWSARREWPEVVRKRFQQVLREARSNQLMSAKEHAEQLLRDVPDMQDVADLLKWIEDRLRAPAVGKKLPTFTEVFSTVERSWFEEGERLSEKNEQAHAALEAAGPTPEELIKPRGGVLKIILPLIFIVAAAAGALFPFPYKVPVKYELQAKNTVSVDSPRIATVATVPVKNGDWVEAGAPLVTWDNEGAKKRMAESEAKLKDLNKKLTAMAKGNTKVADAKKKLDKAQADAKKAHAELDAATAKAKGKKNPAVAKADKKAKAADDAVTKAQKAVDASGAGDKTTEMRAEVDKATAELDALKAQAEAPPLAASAAGFVTGLATKAGDVLQPGNAVCKLEDSKTMKVKIAAAGKGGDALQEGQSATLTLPSGTLEAKIEKVVGKEATATVDNKTGALKSGTKGDGIVAAGGRSMISRL